MIISQEQVQRAVEYLRTPSGDAPVMQTRAASGSLSPELMERVHAVLEGCPEVREDRVEHARCVVDGECPSSSEVAEKLIGRVISDSLR